MAGEASMQSDVLKDRLRALGDRHDEAWRIRLHRAISWLRRAESEDEDPDARFIFLWIAFNAAYAQEFGFERSEREQFGRFCGALLSVDAGGSLHRVLFDRFSGPVRTLIDNRYVFEPFWKALREHDSSGQWVKQFEASQRAALRAVMLKETAIVLGIVLDRLYVLRNQLMHGGATWNSRVNRAQVRDGANLLHTLVPLVIGLMLDHPELDVGAIAYPVLRDAG